jgi:exodeoxyribonuclease VIII
MIWEPGIYPNVPMGTYAAIEAVNASALKHAKRSMEHVKAALDGRMGFDSPATDFGTLGHSFVLEPDTINEHYIIDPGPESFRTSKGDIPASHRQTLAFKEWVKAQAPRKVVAGEDFARAKQLADSVSACKRARDMLGNEGRNECVLIWIDPKTGVLCKCRVDRLRDTWILDLKTTRDAGFVFERQISTLDYILQAAFYRRGAAELDGIVRPVGLIAVESEYPFGVRAAPFDDAQLDEADQRIDAYLAQVRTCQLSDVWPGYESPEAWRAADWANEGFEPADFDDVTTEETAGVW